MKKILLLLIIATSFIKVVKSEDNPFKKIMKDWGDASITYRDGRDAIALLYTKPAFTKLVNTSATEEANQNLLKSIKKSGGTAMWWVALQIPIANCNSVSNFGGFIFTTGSLKEHILNINSQPVKFIIFDKVREEYIQGQKISDATIEIKTQKGRNFIVNEFKTKDEVIFTYNGTNTKITTKGFNKAFAKAKKMCQEKVTNRKNAI